jgi:hypothetical protein
MTEAGCLGARGIMQAGSNRVAYVATGGAAGSFPRRAADPPPIPNFVTKLSVVVLQMLGLWGAEFCRRLGGRRNSCFLSLGSAA